VSEPSALFFRSLFFVPTEKRLILRRGVGQGQGQLIYESVRRHPLRLLLAVWRPGHSGQARPVHRLHLPVELGEWIHRDLGQNGLNRLFVLRGVVLRNAGRG
jgi:hypothetical protein